MKNPPHDLGELPQNVRTAQKHPYGITIKELKDKLTSFFKRGQFCFSLNSIVIVETNVFTYEKASLIIGFQLYAVNALGFEN